MKIHKIIKSTVILCAILCTGITLPGCVGSGVDIPDKLDEISLNTAFNEVVEKTNVNKDTVEFRKLRLHTDQNGIIDSFSFSFYAISNTGKEIYNDLRAFVPKIVKDEPLYHHIENIKQYLIKNRPNLIK